ncbi:MAG: hypothetical protein ABJC09_11945 [Terriglobia bacterium]
MKKVANRMILIAVGALTLGSVVYGQTAMTAEIPFAFRASGTTMPAGKYQVRSERMNTGVVVVQMRNVAANRSVLAVGGPPDWRNEGKARITFLCRPDSCYLSQIRTQSGTTSYAAPKAAPHDHVASAISLPLTIARGE